MESSGKEAMKSNSLLVSGPRVDETLFLAALAIGLGLVLGLLTAWISPLWTAVLLIGIAFVPIALKRPELFVLAYLVISASVLHQTKQESISLGFGTLYLTDVLLLMPLGLIFVRWLAEPHFHLTRTPLDAPLLIFLVTSVLSTVIAVVSGAVPFLATLGEIRVVASYLLFFAVTNLITEKRQVTLLVEGILLLATVAGLATILQSLLGPSFVVLAGRIEAFSTQQMIYRVIPPGQSILVVAFLTLVAFLILEKPGVLNFNIWRYVQCGVTGVAVLITFFRASWVSLGLCLLILAYIVGHKARQRFTIWALTAIVIVGLAVLVFAGQPDSRGATFMATVADRLNSLADPATYTDPASSLRWRDFEYTYAVPKVLANLADPFVGLGYGATYRPLLPPRDWAGFDGRGFIHNGFLWIMLKSGIVGFLGMLWFLVAALVRGLKHWKEVPEPNLRAAVVAFSLVFVIVLIVSNVEPYVTQGGWPPTIAVIAGIDEVLIGKLAAARQAKAGTL